MPRGQVVATPEHLLAFNRGGWDGTLPDVVTALTDKDCSRKLALDPDTLRKMRGRFGPIEGWWKQQFGYGFDGLTESEARAALTFGKGRLSADGLRNRILAGKIPQVGSVGEEATGDRPDTAAFGAGGRITGTAAFREFFGDSLPHQPDQERQRESGHARPRHG